MANEAPTKILLICAAVAAAIAMAAHTGEYIRISPAFSAAIVLLCAVPSARNRLTRWLGGVSYPLYLNAWIGIFAFHAAAKRLQLDPGVGYECLLALCAVAGAAVTYHMIDRVVMENRARCFSPRLGWGLAALAYAMVTVGAIYGRHEIARSAGGMKAHVCRGRSLLQLAKIVETIHVHADREALAQTPQARTETAGAGGGSGPAHLRVWPENAQGVAHSIAECLTNAPPARWTQRPRRHGKAAESDCRSG